MRVFNYLSSSILILSLLLFVNSNAQNLNCQVSVQIQHLQPRDQEELVDLQRKLTSYLNNRSWSEENNDIVIDSNVQLIVETVTDRGSEKIYRSQFLIGSPSGANYYDKNCEFTYISSQAFEAFRTAFDPLLDLVDYYAYMVLGGEMDTYELRGGSSFYEKAQDIANQGRSSNSSSGWTDRLEKVILITDGDHVPLREAKFYYYEGLYFVESNVNPQNARKLATAVVDRLEKVANKQPDSPALKRFLDAHFQEFCNLFAYDMNRKNVNRMIQIDARHRRTYENCQPKF